MLNCQLMGSDKVSVQDKTPPFQASCTSLQRNSRSAKVREPAPEETQTVNLREHDLNGTIVETTHRT